MATSAIGALNESGVVPQSTTNEDDEENIRAELRQVVGGTTIQPLHGYNPNASSPYHSPLRGGAKTSIEKLPWMKLDSEIVFDEPETAEQAELYKKQQKARLKKIRQGKNPKLDGTSLEMSLSTKGAQLWAKKEQAYRAALEKKKFRTIQTPDLPKELLSTENLMAQHKGMGGKIAGEGLPVGQSFEYYMRQKEKAKEKPDLDLVNSIAQPQGEYDFYSPYDMMLAAGWKKPGEEEGEETSPQIAQVLQREGLTVEDSVITQKIWARKVRPLGESPGMGYVDDDFEYHQEQVNIPGRAPQIRWIKKPREKFVTGGTVDDMIFGDATKTEQRYELLTHASGLMTQGRTRLASPPRQYNSGRGHQVSDVDLDLFHDHDTGNNFLQEYYDLRLKFTGSAEDRKKWREEKARKEQEKKRAAAATAATGAAASFSDRFAPTEASPLGTGLFQFKAARPSSVPKRGVLDISSPLHPFSEGKSPARAKPSGDSASAPSLANRYLTTADYVTDVREEDHTAKNDRIDEEYQQGVIGGGGTSSSTDDFLVRQDSSFAPLGTPGLAGGGAETRRNGGDVYYTSPIQDSSGDHQSWEEGIAKKEKQQPPQPLYPSSSFSSRFRSQNAGGEDYPKSVPPPYYTSPTNTQGGSSFGFRASTPSGTSGRQRSDAMIVKSGGSATPSAVAPRLTSVTPPSASSPSSRGGRSRADAVMFKPNSGIKLNLSSSLKAALGAPELNPQRSGYMLQTDGVATASPAAAPAPSTSRFSLQNARPAASKRAIGARAGSPLLADKYLPQDPDL